MCSEENIILYYYNEVSSEQRSEIENHLYGCCLCQDFLSTLTETTASYRSLQKASVDADLTEKITNDLKSITKNKVKLSFSQQILSSEVFVRVAAMLLISIGIFSVFVSDKPQTDITTQETQSSSWDGLTKDIAQVQKKVKRISRRNYRPWRTTSIHRSQYQKGKIKDNIKFRIYSSRNSQFAHSIRSLRKKIVRLNSKIEKM